VTYLADDPTISNVLEEARSVKGRMPAMDTERILALEPDLVVVPPYTRREVVAQLEEGGVAILRMPDCWSLDDIRLHLRFLGQAFAVEARAEELIAEMDRALNRFKV
jgi:ABC-type Fe3+-hydroxamate transport system substrate-binding protein